MNFYSCVYLSHLLSWENPNHICCIVSFERCCSLNVFQVCVVWAINYTDIISLISSFAAENWTNKPNSQWFSTKKNHFFSLYKIPTKRKNYSYKKITGYNNLRPSNGIEFIDFLLRGKTLESNIFHTDR